MAITDKMWDALTTVIRMNDKVEALAGTVKAQQERIENLTGRIIRLETALEIALSRQATISADTARIEPED
ncbi:hypothetical protein [Acidithiobacillus caldus]|jgi:hypothetical protein|uniref:Uncharacterized protein n=3 Tax=Acidithiobacillus caldus TaxID=33059 RepID=F9ZUT1_ACICS|nr:hypothetical protein [Acidithiobacillus caldus]AEK59645.1 conserved hypothetical protein [Acidithiobacillus caldus SM-1]AIA56652.1 hypothetical protein Acaty_m0079 [Acidithiobacillus caldus ATCC 51756]AUW34155.1 hypothetical protein A5904_14485 [Acidithiobacillus caldus]MBU2729227.1 hypothetical protein [Acidithiobacillus caldus]MBU2735758.1 hypothetical protein [Acidithiobacillus caldus ATCC 51756]